MCGGRAARLWPVTLDTAKVLLPVAGKPAIEYILDFIQDSQAVEKISLSVDETSAPQIQNFLVSSKSQINHRPIELIIDPPTKGKGKWGPIGALDHIVKHSGPRELLIVGGDNLFGFRLDEFLHSCDATEGCSYNAVYNNFAGSQLSEYGTVETDELGHFVEFFEKAPSSKHKAISTACYFFREADVALVHRYAEESHDSKSFGNFIHWLLMKDRSRIKSFNFSSPWFDIGTRESLLQANKHYLQHAILGEIQDTSCQEPVCVFAGARVLKSVLGSFVFIGSDTQVRDSKIRNSIIMERCIIEKSIVNNSVIGPGRKITGRVIDTLY
jgi:glucose-1-phosphate thymidylyltransferase